MKRMMKAMKAMVAAAAVAVTFAANAAVYHDPGTGFDWAYSVINGNEAMLSNGDGDIPYQYSAISRLSAEGEIAIPTYMDGYRVTAIGPKAFQECNLMTKVTIPDGVTVIGFNAFWGCSRLEGITLPNSVTQIGDYAFLNCGALRSVNLGTGLETIGKSAFLRAGIIDLTLSTSLESVGSDVFRYCDGLTQVTIPGSLKTVGSQMFAQCTSLNSVTISSGVTTIGAYAFDGSTLLEYVTIPSTVAAIENNAFRNCPLKAVYVGFGETARVRNLFRESNFDGYATLNIVEEAPVTKTVTFNSNGGTSPNVFRKYVQGSAIVKVPRPKKPGYSYTGWWTAESGGTQISSETIVMDNVTYYAQWEEGENKTLVDDDGVRWNAGGSGYEGSRTVYSYYPQTRKNATIPAAHANGDVIAAIHEQFSWGSTKPLESIMIPATIASIQMNAFGPGSGAAMSFPNLKTVYVNKNDAARIEGLLRGTSYAANVDNLTFVETDPFYFTVTFDVNGGNALATTTKEVEFGAPCGSLPIPTRTAGEHEWQFVGWFTSASGGDEVTAATILQHKSNYLLDRTLYAHWSEIIVEPENHTWEDPVTGSTWHYQTLNGQATIVNHDDGRYYCAVDPEPSGELAIPSVLGGCPVTAIGYKAFYDCRGITALTIPSSVRKIGGWAFEDCRGLTSLVLPDSVASIDYRAFMGCNELRSVYVPAGAALAADMEFRDCFNLRDPEKDYLIIVNGVLYDWEPYDTPLATINWPKIPSGVTTIAEQTFISDHPERITIPETVTSIRENAFYNCSGTLTTIYYRPGDSEARIRSLFAAGDTGIDISTITVAEEPEFTVTFNANGGTGGTSVQREYAEAIGTLPRPTRDGCTYVGWFDDPEGGGQIVSADKVRGDVTYYAHWQSEGDPKWTDNDGFTWRYQIDDGKARVRDVTPSSKAVDLVVPATLGGCAVTVIGMDCFRSVDTMKSVVIPPGVTEIGTYAFYRCTALESVSMPSSVTRIDTYAFCDCSSLASVTIPAGVTLIDTGAFSDCDSLTSVILPSGVTTVGDYAFGSCTALESVTIPKSLTSFGYRMFNNVTTIKTVYVEYGDTARVRTALEAADLDCTGINFIEGAAPPTFTVTFDGNGGTPGEASRLVEQNTAVGELPSATRAGYWAFDGWWTAETGGTQVDASTLVTADVEYFAHWTDTTPPDYATILGAPAGMTFVSSGDKTWVAGGTVDEKTTVKSGLEPTDHSKSSTLTATFSGAGTLSFYYKVESEGGYDKLEVFIDGGGNCLAGTYQNSGTVSWTKFEEVLAAGDHTVVWTYSKDSSNSIGRDCAWLADVSFGEVAPPTQYTVTFNGNGGLVAGDVATTTLQVNDGAAVGPLPSATLIGYTLAGWFTAASGGTEIETTTPVTADVEYFAHWTPNTYTVTFDKNGGDSVTPPSKTVTYDATYGELPTPARAGYWSFDGWFTASSGGSQVTATTPVTITAAQTLYAHWTDTTPPPPTWTVTFNANGGNCVEDQRAVDDGDSIGALPAATRTGYTQNGWWTAADGGTEVYTDTSVTADTEVFAHWTPNTYTVYFDGNSGTPAEASKTVTYDSTYGTLPSATRDGNWTLEGWWTTTDNSGVKVEETTTVKITDDQTLYAHWTETTPPPPTWTVTFNSNGGSCVEDQRAVDDGDSIGALPAATLTGYTQNGWWTAADGGTEVYTDTPIRADTEVFAHWTPNTYTVYFDGNGGTPSAASITVTYDSTYGAMPTAELDGWSFDGWWTAAEGGTLVTASSAVTITDDQTLYAHWTDSGYVVTFDANGGVAEFDRVTREFSAAVGSMPQAVKDGFALGGWLTDGGDEVTPATPVTASFTCHAYWVPDDGWTYETAVVDGIEWTYRALGDGKSAELYNRGNPVIPADTVGAVTVPAKLNGRNVVSIRDRAFYALDGITAVIVPDTVTGIGVDAFAFCTSLEAVQCGKKVASVGSGAFRYCASLIAVEFKNAEPIFPDDDLTTFQGANSIYWQVNVPKTARKWPDEWRGRGVNKYPYNAHIAIGFLDPTENPEYGKIPDFRNTEIGKKLALKATANKGYASAGWYDGETGRLITRAASYSYTVTGEDRVFLADFVTVEDDIASLAIALFDVTTATDGSIEIDLGAATASYSEPKFAVKGLPAGLKYDTKTLKIAGKATKPGVYTVEVKATNASQKQATAASTGTFVIVVPNKTDAEIPLDDSYGPYVPGSLYTEIVPAAVGCKASGLPSGMKWTEKEIVDKTMGLIPAYSFYGAAAKPGNYTVTFTKTIGKEKHEATATVVVGPLPKLTLTPIGNVDGCKVTGAGDYPANKGVSLKATAGAGNVFSCWIDVETGDIISRAANYTYTMADHDKTLYAEFTTAAEDAAHLALNVGGFAQFDQNQILVDDNAVWNETTIPQGVYVEWPLVPITVSFATITVSGLPTGLKFTAKNIVDSKTGAVIVPANTIYGVPTAASKNVSGVYTPSRVKIAMTTAGKVKSEYTLDLTVTEMEPWAVGPFNGGYNNICQATLTVASSGKISGKLLFFDGDTCTFAADSFSSFDGSIYTAHVAAKLGGETSLFTLRIGEGEIGGEAQLVDEDGNVMNLWQTDWKSDQWKAIAAPFAKAGSISLVEADKSVTLKFDTSGAVKLAGEFFVNSTWIKASSSATVIPTEMYGDDGSFGGWVFIYFPPKTGKYDGIVRRQYLRWSAANKSFSFEPIAP